MDNQSISILSKENGVLTLSIEGQINSANVSTIETELNRLLVIEPHEQLTLDAARLEYISSAGLRMLLKTSKTERLKIQNVTADIYEVFAMTGFTKILDIQRAFRRVNTYGCELLGEGINGAVYRLSPETIVKVYQPGTPIEFIERERNYAQAAFLNGVPTAISYDVVRCGDSLGIIFELIDANTFNHKLHRASEADFRSHVQRYIDILRTMHHSTVQQEELPDIKAMYHRWINELTTFYTSDELNLMRQMVDNVPDRNTIIHGDFHPRNMMTQGNELLLIDMADVSHGHPIFDLAGIGLTHYFYPTESPESCMRFIGMEADELKLLWRSVLAGYFGTKDETELQARHNEILPYILLRYSVNPAIIPHLPDELKRESVRIARERLFPTLRAPLANLTF